MGISLPRLLPLCGPPSMLSSTGDAEALDSRRNKRRISETRRSQARHYVRQVSDAEGRGRLPERWSEQVFAARRTSRSGHRPAGSRHSRPQATAGSPPRRVSSLLRSCFRANDGCFVLQQPTDPSIYIVWGRGHEMDRKKKPNDKYAPTAPYDSSPSEPLKTSSGCQLYQASMEKK